MTVCETCVRTTRRLEKVVNFPVVQLKIMEYQQTADISEETESKYELYSPSFLSALPQQCLYLPSHLERSQVQSGQNRTKRSAARLGKFFLNIRKNTTPDLCR